MAITAKQRLERLRELQSTGQLQPTARERLDELRDLDLVDTSPFELPERSPALTASFLAEFGTEPPPVVSDEAAQLAAQGVDVISGSPVGRVASGFAQNEALQANDLKDRLSEFYGRPVRVLQGPLGLEFINPETNRRTLVDEATTTFRDVADIAGPALPAAGAAVGSVGGALLAGAGGAAGEATRRGIGELLGVRDESLEEAALGTLGVGALEAGFTKASEGVVRLAQTFRRFFRPDVIEPDVAARILDEAESSQAIADEIAERTGQPFQPRTSQLSRDPDLLQADEVVRTSQRFGPGIRKIQEQNETTLETFFDELNPSGDVADTQVGRAIQNEARRQTQPRVRAAQDSVEARQEELERLTSELPRATDAEIRRDLSRQAQESLTILKDSEDAAWDAARQAYGYNPDTALSNVQVPIDGRMARTLRQLQAEANQAIDPTVASGKTALVPEGLKENSVDLHQLNVHLGQLKRRLRLAKEGEVITDPSGRDISRVVSDLQKARDDYLRQTNPALGRQLLDAESQTANRARLFDKSITGMLVRKENGAYELADRTLVAEALGSGDKEAIEHLVSALDNHPAGVPTLQKAFLAHYRNQVVEDGVPNAAAHRRFVSQNEETIEALFPNNNRIRRLGQMEAETTKSVKRFEDFQRAVQSSFRGKIQDIAPERVAEDIFKRNFTNKDIRRLMNLAKAAGVQDDYVRAAGNLMRNRFVSKTSGVNLNALEKFVNQNKERLATVFGPRYARDMEVLLKGLDDIRTTGAGIQTTTKPTMLGALAEAVARVTVARPLSPAGVGLTRIKSTRALAAENVMNEIITDPDALRAIVANRNKPLQSQTVGRILGALGGSALLDEEDNSAVDAARGLVQ